jgi:hypothetical protein
MPVFSMTVTDDLLDLLRAAMSDEDFMAAGAGRG